MASAQGLSPLLCCFLLLAPKASLADDAPSAPAKIVISSGTPIKLQFAKTISSGTLHRGDRVEFVVEKDVTAGGFTVVKAGASAAGSVEGVKKRRMLGMGGGIVIKLDSVELSTGEKVALVARQKYKGKSHTLRMGMEIALASAVYLPVAPVFLLSQGRNSTVLKGTEITAYTRNESAVETANLEPTTINAWDLPELVKLLPPRATNGEGREGDMLNLIFVAKEDDLQAAFARGGWVTVETSHPQIIWHLIWQREHYTKLPMDRLYVFGRPQDYSYALPDPSSIVARRHHLRIWRTDREVDGVPVWVGAATHDVGVDFVKRKFWVFHRIDPNVDAEREFIAANLAENQRLIRKEYVDCSEPVVGAQTATGQAFYSDSRMLLIGLNSRLGATAVASGGSAFR
jgi:hypothetical protein